LRGVEKKKDCTDHYRYVKILLADPHHRICSTANVPPQQSSWWFDRIPGILRRRGCPQEIFDQMMESVPRSMNVEEAKQHNEVMSWRVRAHR
jgi:hypothetical protein